MKVQENVHQVAWLLASWRFLHDSLEVVSPVGHQVPARKVVFYLVADKVGGYAGLPAATDEAGEGRSVEDIVGVDDNQLALQEAFSSLESVGNAQGFLLHHKPCADARDIMG